MFDENDGLTFTKEEEEQAKREFSGDSLKLYYVQKAKHEGNEELAHEIMQTIEYHAPHTLMAIKQTAGAEYVRNMGLNLKSAEEKYGKDWLDR